MTRPDILLAEYETRTLPPDALTFEEGVALWRGYDQKGKKIHLTFPSPKTDGLWELTAQGWVGQIPLSRDLTICIQPRLPLVHLFRLWEYAYHLQSYQLLDGLADVQTLADFYERVVQLLCMRVGQRECQGFYRAYQSVTAVTPFVRGQIQTRPVGYSAHSSLLCRYDEQTSDVPENQILAFTLNQVARGGHCSPMVQTAVRRTAHHLQQIATPHPFRPNDCVARPYTRLNQDYAVMHALCRFLLEHQSPATMPGNQTTAPFLINMPRLYELFVAEWLKTHLPAPWQVNVQELVTVGKDDEIRFDIDLVLYDEDGRVHAVLDTKYKLADKATNPDISQVITYAQAKGSPRAILIYPAALAQPLDVHMHHLHIRSLTFAVEGDLEANGQQFLAHLLA